MLIPLQNSDKPIQIDDEIGNYLLTKYGEKFYLNKHGAVSIDTGWPCYFRTVARIVMRVHRTDYGVCVDHINGDKFDNRKQNLRLATKAQNNINRIKQRGTISKYIGVTFDKSRNKWCARVSLNNQTVNGGRFNTEIEAAIKADDLRLEHFGEFAKLNFQLYGA